MALKTKKTIKGKQIKKALTAFYNKPIAQISTELFFTIFAVLFFAMLAIRPTILTMADLVKEIKDKRVTSEALSKKIASLSTAQSEYFVLQNRLYLLDEVLPENPEIMQVLLILEKLASEKNLTIVSISSPDVPQRLLGELDFSKKQIVTQHLTFSVTGDFAAIRGFIEEIAAVRPLLTLESISIDRSEDRVDQSLRASVTIQMYYFGLEKKEK